MMQIVSSTAGRLEAKAARAPGEMPSWAKAQARAKRAGCGLGHGVRHVGPSWAARGALPGWLCAKRAHGPVGKF